MGLLLEAQLKRVERQSDVRFRMDGGGGGGGGGGSWRKLEAELEAERWRQKGGGKK
jgi:hypothetical protein